MVSALEKGLVIVKISITVGHLQLQLHICQLQLQLHVIVFGIWLSYNYMPKL